MLSALILGPSLALALDCSAVQKPAQDSWAPLQHDIGETVAPRTLEGALAHQQELRCSASMSLPADGYVKQTEFDNTPYRFNMKPGQKLSAEEFDAWMKSRGIRIVPAKPAAAETVQTAEQ